MMPAESRLDARLREPWLTTARIIWIALAVSAIVLYVSNLPFLLDPQASLCNPPAVPCMRSLILPQEAELLPQIGLTLAQYHLSIQLTESLLFASMWLVVSALIFWRRSDEPIAVLTSFLMIGFPFSLVGGGVPNAALWQIVLSSFVTLFNGLLATLLFIFPTGRFVPRWSRWVVYAFGVIWIARVIGYAYMTYAYPNMPPTGVFGVVANLMTFIYFGVFSLSVICQAYRYWRVSNVTERRQTKWIVLAILSLPVLDLLLRAVSMWLFPEFYQPGIPHLVFNLVSNPIFTLGFFLVPIAFAVSIFRYHLYAIDIFIRRTIIYALFTFTLVVIYYGSVVLLQRVVSTITRTDNEIAVILSTLAIAVIFMPLRNHIQNVIDKRFYRKKYDAQQVLTKFATTVRDETDLDRLTNELLNVVNETMQPKSASVWLKTQRERGTRE